MMHTLLLHLCTGLTVCVIAMADVCRGSELDVPSGPSPVLDGQSGLEESDTPLDTRSEVTEASSSAPASSAADAETAFNHDAIEPDDAAREHRTYPRILHEGSTLNWIEHLASPLWGDWSHLLTARPELAGTSEVSPIPPVRLHREKDVLEAPTREPKLGILLALRDLFPVETDVPHSGDLLGSSLTAEQLQQLPSPSQNMAGNSPAHAGLVVVDLPAVGGLIPAPEWLPELAHDWNSVVSAAVLPWAICAAVGFLLLVVARLLGRRSDPHSTGRSRTHHQTRQTGPVAGSQSAVDARQTLLPGNQPTSGELASATGAGELDSLLDALGPPADDAAHRDKSEERRQLESLRKLSQAASKAFILQEEQEAAKEHAMWLSLVAIALGVCGLGIIATGCLENYSLLAGACLTATGLVMLSWSGLKVIFHQLRRWILLRPIRS